MKRIHFILFIAFAGLAACQKEIRYNAAFEPISPNSMFIKFVHAYPYATPSYSATPNGPTLQLSYNNGQLSATPIALGVTYPAGPDYARVQDLSALDLNIRMSTGIPPAAVRDSALFTFNLPFNAGKYYSLFFMDSLANPARRMLVVEDDIRLPGGPNLYRVRFANLLANMPAGTPTLELFSRRAGAVIFTNIPSRGVTPFIELPTQGTTGTVADTFQIRYTGSTTALATLNNVGIQTQSSITVTAVGRVGSTGTLGPRVLSHRNR
ncbi:MAG TPA: hypothetical protein PKE63_09175 [Lacibacter sp.]|nr:hypothetical protein [Lacibacter sp.]HMO89660.1 hypothetical protein [Lacibacter sp.]HMP87435.1 hypothetical protein [Lacibacter sp.]